MDDWKEIDKKKYTKPNPIFGGPLVESQRSEIVPPKYTGGADFDAQLDELAFNRVIRFKNLAQKPQGNADVGKIYWDTTDSKLRMWVGGTAKWVDISYTSTSTSTTSSSSSSISTSTTSSSTSTTSSSSSSTSTTTI